MLQLTKNEYVIDISTKKLAEEFVSSLSEGKRYAFGKNQHSQVLLKNIRLEAIVDDYAPEGTIWNGLPVIKRVDLPSDAIVVNCVTCIGPITVKNLLEQQGVKFFGVYALSQLFTERFEILDFVKEARDSYENNKDRWQKLYNSLEDEESIKTFSNVMQYRLTGDYHCMTEYGINYCKQYFDFLKLEPGEVFADCGGSDGDSSDGFIKNCPDFKKIYMFEPCEENIIKAQKRLNNNPKIEFIQKGLSDKEEILCFHVDGPVSYICADGETKIKTTSLDIHIKEKITLIKMDIEGFELKALEGAKEHIKNDKPKLAISVYHRPQDFYEVFEFVKSIHPDYKVYFRHYNEGWGESVLYFIP